MPVLYMNIFYKGTHVSVLVYSGQEETMGAPFFF